MRKIIRLKIFFLVLLAMVVMLSLSTPIANAVDSQDENFPITMCHSDYYIQNFGAMFFNDGVNKANVLYVVDVQESQYEIEAWVQVTPLSWPGISGITIVDPDNHIRESPIISHNEHVFLSPEKPLGDYLVIYFAPYEQIWDLWLTVYHWEDGFCPLALE